VAIYTRRSTDEEHQPFSIDAQTTALRAYVASQPGWTVVMHYTDDASGATTDRPGLQRALREAREHRYDVLLVYRVDRFSRRLADMLALMRDLDTTGVAFCSATESFDTSTPAATHEGGRSRSRRICSTVSARDCSGGITVSTSPGSRSRSRYQGRIRSGVNSAAWRRVE